MSLIPGTSRSADAAPMAVSWEELMVATQRGDRAAYDRLLRDVLPLLRRIARRHFANHADAEDAVQDTLITIHTLRHAYDPSRPLRPWIATLCERRCIDRMRWHRRHAGSERPLPDAAHELPAPGMGEDAERLVVHRELHAMVATLPKSQRIAISLTKLQELPLVEASARSGMAVGALKIATFRGVRSLRDRFAAAEAA